MYKRTKARTKKFHDFLKKHKLEIGEELDQTKIEELLDEQDRQRMRKFNEIFHASLNIEEMIRIKQENRKKSLTT